jgi:hypothetical protein
MTVVEVVPLVAGAAPVIVGSGVVGAVVGVLRLLVQGASLGVLDERLGVQVGRLLAVEDGAHLIKSNVRTFLKTGTPAPLHQNRTIMNAQDLYVVADYEASN